LYYFRIEEKFERTLIIIKDDMRAVSMCVL